MKVLKGPDKPPYVIGRPNPLSRRGSGSLRLRPPPLISYTLLKKRAAPNADILPILSLIVELVQAEAQLQIRIIRSCSASYCVLSQCEASENRTFSTKVAPFKKTRLDKLWSLFARAPHQAYQAST